MSLLSAVAKLINIFARVLGLLATLGGASMLLTAATDAVRGGGSLETLVAVFVGAALAMTGFALLRVRAYRPDLGDGPLSRPSPEATEARRAWWTGDPK